LQVNKLVLCLLSHQLAPNEMLKASTNGEVRVADKNVNQKFVVVDFQDSYGKAQG
jgi:hypothetical protein